MPLDAKLGIVIYLSAISLFSSPNGTDDISRCMLLWFSQFYDHSGHFCFIGVVDEFSFFCIYPLCSEQVPDFLIQMMVLCLNRFICYNNFVE